ncbi:DUF2141 domain-containing protein [Marinobacter sp. LV10R520-4]
MDGKLGTNGIGIPTEGYGFQTVQAPSWVRLRSKQPAFRTKGET